MVNHGITVVVSPLLALMNDQVSALKASGIAVATLNSKTPPNEKTAILEDLRSGHPRSRLLYVTPELCQTETFRRHLRTVYDQQELSRIAIDEAHCISEWGHDFRPAYRHLSYFRNTFPETPIICLTATATTRVRSDIIKSLGLDPLKLEIFTTTTSRSNLHYEVRFTSESDDTRFSNFVEWLRGVHERRGTDPRKMHLKLTGKRSDAFSGIIYTDTRNECEALAGHLRAAKIGAAAYHAGLPNEARLECQTKWLVNEPGFDVIVATTAFGMGIDKEDVRFVVHWSMPKSFEGFYQEAGRAGRDGNASFCLLYYSREGRDRRRWMIERDLGGANGREQCIEGRVESFRKLTEYCENTTRCRHKTIVEYFGESGDAALCDLACDWCKDFEGLKQRKDKGLASEEWMSTQMERENIEVDCYE